MTERHTMTLVFVIIAVAVILGLLVLASRRQRRHAGNMNELEEGHTKGYRYMGGGGF